MPHGWWFHLFVVILAISAWVGWLFLQLWLKITLYGMCLDNIENLELISRCLDRATEEEQARPSPFKG